MIVYPDGGYYRGNLGPSGKEGPAEIGFPNGDVYKGMVHANKLEGAGKYHYKNGDVFEGIFSNNKKEGSGSLKKNDGSIIKTTWVNDLKEGPGFVIDALDDNVTYAILLLQPESHLLQRLHRQVEAQSLSTILKGMSCRFTVYSPRLREQMPSNRVCLSF